MKTAEEWATQHFPKRSEAYKQYFIDAFKQIQLDAYRAGMTEAAKLVTNGSFIHELAPDSIMARSISKLILSARDKKETV